jgi:hypothetical protein
MSDGRLVIVAYRAKPGRVEDLIALTRRHVPELRALGLVTDRPPVAMRAADDTVVEVFEWTADGIARAHEHPAVLAMWGDYAEVCDYVPLRELPEAAAMFAEFAPIDL